MGNTQLNFNDKKSYVVKDRDLDQRRGKKKKKAFLKKRGIWILPSSSNLDCMWEDRVDQMMFQSMSEAEEHASSAPDDLPRSPLEVC